MSRASPIDDPIHSEAQREQRWSRQIVAEALPGVLTPLNWSIWGESGERSMRAAHYDVGVLPASAVEPPEDPDERGMAIFYGRAAVSIDRLRAWAELTPGVSGAQFEAHYHGSEGKRSPIKLAFRRYPIVAAKLPRSVAGLPRRLTELRSGANDWWREVTRDQKRPREGAEFGARERITASREWLHRVARPHALNNIVIVPIYDGLSRLAHEAGREDSLPALTSGYGGLEETAMAADLWAVSRGRRSLESFLATHGYHGPDEGEIASFAWRELPKPVEALVERDRRGLDAGDPRVVEGRLVQARELLQDELLASLPPQRRPWAHLLFRLARTYLPLRQVGHNASVQMLDAIRAPVRELAEVLVAKRILEQPDDVFFLTIDELLAGPPPDARERVGVRRERWHAYRELDLPAQWSGVAVAQPVAKSGETSAEPIEGFGVSPGIAEGRARVVTRASDADALERGEILICHTTDPSWTPYFSLAAGVVIEIGGPLSHGAIVARELGIPCIIVENATRRVRDRSQIRVDASAGRVEPLLR